MAKKSFADKNPALQYLTQDHPEGSPQHTHDVPEPHREDSAPKTPGGYKETGRRLPRFNLALPAERIKYLQLASRIDGVSVTEYINRLITADREARAGELERAKAILKGAE